MVSDLPSFVLIVKENQSLFLIIGALLAAFAIGLLVHQYVHSRYTRNRLKKQFNRATQGEQHAKIFLKEHGFRIIAEQAHLDQSMWVDGKQESYSVRADYLVSKGRRRAVVEVKTGSAADPCSRDTRRQLLEYAILYQVEDVYLFDGDQQRLLPIRFDKIPLKKRFASRLWWLVGLIVTICFSLLVICDCDSSLASFLKANEADIPY